MSTTGEAVFDSNGNWKNKERVVSDKIIGAHVDNENGKETRTKAAVIVYSKTEMCIRDSPGGIQGTAD